MQILKQGASIQSKDNVAGTVGGLLQKLTIIKRYMH